MIRRLKKQNLTLFDAAGRILAEPLFSKTDSPPFRRFAMDGYAICSRDYEGKPMLVAGCNDAGIPRVHKLLPGQAVRIMTGGIDHMVVFEKIEAGIVSTGNELVRPGEKPARGQIYGSSHLYLFQEIPIQPPVFLKSF